MPGHVLTECELAARLRYRKFRGFQKALREGRIPRPDIRDPDGDLWSETRIEAWLTGDGDGRGTSAEESPATGEVAGLRDALTEERVARARAESRAEALAAALATAEGREAAAMVELAALRAELVEALRRGR